MDEDFVGEVCGALQQCQRQLQDTGGAEATEELYNVFHPEGESRGYADDATWIMTSSFVIFTMQTGFGLLEMGCCSSGHEVNILLKNAVDVVCGSLAYYLFGYAISFGEPSTPFMGLGEFVPTGGIDSTFSGLLFSRYIFQLSFAATSTTIVSGCAAMRMRFFVYCLYSMYSVFVYAFLAHWVWASNGWLAQLGFHDFAGGSCVHLLGGIAGLVAILFLGPRAGRFDGTRPHEDFLPASPSSILFGLFMLWWGWIGFNCGSTFGVTDDRWVVATRAAITTVNASSGGGIMGIALSMAKSQGSQVRPEDITNGILGSLVGITPCCDCVNTYAAFFIGAFGALIAIRINDMLPSLRIDDPVGAIGVHGGSAVWGLLAVGMFGDSSLPGTGVADGVFYGGSFSPLQVQFLGVLVTIVWGMSFSALFFYFVGAMVSGDLRNPRPGLRMSLKEEIEGVDCHLHGIEEWQRDLPQRVKDSDTASDTEEGGPNMMMERFNQSRGKMHIYDAHHNRHRERRNESALPAFEED